jgi:hypothetical protein
MRSADPLPTGVGTNHPLRLLLATTALGVVALLFRLLTDRGLSNDHYMHMAWAQQILMGEIPGRDFVDPGMPLAYLLSAAVQYVAPWPYSEGVFSAAMLALAAMATCLAVGRLTGSAAWGVSAGLLEIALQPRYYSYPKILVPPVTLLALAWYAAAPSRRRVTLLAAWSVVAGLLRYDLGVYTVLAVSVGLAAFEGRDWRNAVRSLAAYAARLFAIGLPYVAYVQVTEGVPAHIRGSLEFGKSDQQQFAFTLPPFPWSMLGSSPAGWAATDAATVLAYAAYALVPAALLVAAAAARRLDRTTRAGVLASIALTACYVAVILRHPIPARVPDLASVLAIVGAWTAAATLQGARGLLATARPVARAAAGALGAVTAAAVAAVAASAWVLGAVDTQIREMRLEDGLFRRLAVHRDAGTVWPWERYWPAGPVPEAVHYLRACTTPSDRLLVTWPAAEYYYFSGRAFGAGLAQLLPPNAFTARSDQELMLARLERHTVPVVLINETERAEFARAYPLLDAYLQERYAPVGSFTIRGGSETITVAVKGTLQPTSTYGPDRWPCGFLPAAAPAGVGRPDSQPTATAESGPDRSS